MPSAEHPNSNILIVNLVLTAVFDRKVFSELNLGLNDKIFENLEISDDD